MSDRQTTDKTGTFDTILDSEGKEWEVFIVEDTPAHMRLRVIKTDQTLVLSKAVQ